MSLNKSFGFSNHLFSKYEIGEEIGRGHFGYTCSARVKKGELKGLDVAVKVIPKAKVFFIYIILTIILIFMVNALYMINHAHCSYTTGSSK